MWNAPTATGTCEKCSVVLKHGELELEVTLPGLCWCCKRHNIEKNENVATKENEHNSQMVPFPFNEKTFLTHLLPLVSPVSMSNIYN